MREKRLLRDRPQGKGPESADSGRLRQKEREEGSSTICPEPAGAQRVPTLKEKSDRRDSGNEECLALARTGQHPGQLRHGTSDGELTRPGEVFVSKVKTYR